MQDVVWKAEMMVLRALGEADIPPVNPPQEKQEASLLERVLAVLTPNQGRIWEYLWAKKTASYAALEKIPKAWRDVPSPEAITKQLKDMKRRIEGANLPVGYIKVSMAGERVIIEQDQDTK